MSDDQHLAIRVGFAKDPRRRRGDGRLRYVVLMSESTSRIYGMLTWQAALELAAALELLARAAATDQGFQPDNVDLVAVAGRDQAEADVRTVLRLDT